jgi:tRNA pseudouridine55 synthase
MILHGLLLLNKPAGLTSHDVVARTRRILQTKSVGHSGTLDPMASGLMVLLIGEATKLSQYILERNKAYRVRAQLGIRTDTLDMTGQTLQTSQEIPTQEKVRAEALGLAGDFEWPIPIFSAAKVDGKKLYEYARSGEEVAIPKKVMSFFDLEIEDQTPEWIDVFIRCSKGSFIRSWVSELGERLGCGAAMSKLERTESLPYHLSQATTFEELEAEVASQAETYKGFIPMSATLGDAKVIRIKGQDQVMMGNGLISHDLRSHLISTFQPGKDEVVKILSVQTGELLALIGLEPGKGFAIRRVFRY